MLQGIVRESIDRQATKALRQDGYLIANIYAKGVENVNAAFKDNEFLKAVRTKETLPFEVEVGGNTYNVVIQDYQKDPLTSRSLHVDLRVLVPGQESKFLVPVKTTGEPKGLKDKGVFVMSKRRLLVQCTPENLPNDFTLDISDLDTGDSILVRDMTIPENVKMRVADRVSVCGVIKAK